jgi:hypothetical protein
LTLGSHQVLSKARQRHNGSLSEERAPEPKKRVSQGYKRSSEHNKLIVFNLL